jgi:hypothetical protein
MTVAEALLRRCSSCGRERPFEQPPCRDGHGDDCPECACIDCGEAILIGLPLIDSWIFDDLPLDDEMPDESGAPWQAA